MQVWVNGDTPKNIGELAAWLDKAVKTHSDKGLKAFIMFIPAKGQEGEAVAKQVADLSAERKIENVGMTYVNGPDDPAVKLYRINTDEKVRNTLFVYKDKKLTAKFINLTANEEGLRNLNEAVTQVLK